MTRLSRYLRGDFHAKNLDSYNHCLHLMFGQMAGYKSQQDIALLLSSTKSQSIPERGSFTLVHGKRGQGYRIFEMLGLWLVKEDRPMYAKKEHPNVYIPRWEIFAIDLWSETSY